MPENLSCTLLVFEDDPNILSMLQTYFENQGTHIVIQEDGKDADAVIERVQPDVIVLDVIMPHQDGFTLLEKLRGSGNETPVIILTDQNRVDDKVTGLELGADDYVTKPFSLRELKARIQAQLRRAALVSQTRHTILSIGPLTIDTGRREITGNNHKDSVVTHKELLKNVLGYEPNTETKALVMHITNLRKKLDNTIPGAVQIIAVPGIGYKLSAAT
ncbi:MAG: hypothetical protein CSB34_07490 [Desulfobulbus propionicus]|nr:MAG: hypothetical protein CSB34_07490 [Desulfobulbus propionicus]